MHAKQIITIVGGGAKKQINLISVKCIEYGKVFMNMGQQMVGTNRKTDNKNNND